MYANRTMASGGGGSRAMTQSGGGGGGGGPRGMMSSYFASKGLDLTCSSSNNSSKSKSSSNRPVPSFKVTIDRQINPKLLEAVRIYFSRKADASKNELIAVFQLEKGFVVAFHLYTTGRDESFELTERRCQLLYRYYGRGNQMVLLYVDAGSAEHYLPVGTSQLGKMLQSSSLLPERGLTRRFLCKSQSMTLTRTNSSGASGCGSSGSSSITGEERHSGKKTSKLSLGSAVINSKGVSFRRQKVGSGQGSSVKSDSKHSKKVFISSSDRRNKPSLQSVTGGSSPLPYTHSSVSSTCTVSSTSSGSSNSSSGASRTCINNRGNVDKRAVQKRNIGMGSWVVGTGLNVSNCSASQNITNQLECLHVSPAMCTSSITSGNVVLTAEAQQNITTTHLDGAQINLPIATISSSSTSFPVFSSTTPHSFVHNCSKTFSEERRISRSSSQT